MICEDIVNLSDSPVTSFCQFLFLVIFDQSLVTYRHFLYRALRKIFNICSQDGAFSKIPINEEMKRSCSFENRPEWPPGGVILFSDYKLIWGSPLQQNRMSLTSTLDLSHFWTCFPTSSANIFISHSLWVIGYDSKAIIHRIKFYLELSCK